MTPMSRSRVTVCVLVATATLVSSGGLAAVTGQQSPPVLRSSVDLVTIDVQVTPAKGAPFRQFTVTDFDIRISGQKRVPASATFKHYDEGPVSGKPGSSSPKTAPASECVYRFERKTKRPTAHYVIGIERSDADRRAVNDVKVRIVDNAFKAEWYTWRSPVRSSLALPFSCEAFSPSSSAADLASRFGTANVKTAQVPWGGAEGEFNEGTVLFDGSADARLEIYWRDTPNKRGPEWVSVRGKSTRWQSPAGIKLGTTLRAIEQLNSRPFRLLGFGSDASGTVLNWDGGSLTVQDEANCRVRVRVSPEWENMTPSRSALINQVGREQEFSSGHPAMQALNPTVYEMTLQYNPSHPWPTPTPTAVWKPSATASSRSR